MAWLDIGGQRSRSEQAVELGRQSPSWWFRSRSCCVEVEMTSLPVNVHNDVSSTLTVWWFVTQVVMHDGMQYDPIQGQGQVHKPLVVMIMMMFVTQVVWISTRQWKVPGSFVSAMRSTSRSSRLRTYRDFCQVGTAVVVVMIMSW